MGNENLPMKKAELNFFQKIRKQFLLRNIRSYKYEKSNFPKYLKNDIDILYALSKKEPYFFENLEKEQQKMVLEYNPDIFLNEYYTSYNNRNKIIQENPIAISKIFDKLSSKDKETLLKEYPEYIKQLKKEDAISYILGGIHNYSIRNEEINVFELITFLPEDVQVQLLTKNIQFVDYIRDSSCQKNGSPNDFKDKLDYFSENALIEAVTILNERAKTETRDNVPLLEVMTVDNLPIETQKKLLAIDRKLVNRMSVEVIIEHIENNPMSFLKKLDDNKKIEVIKLKPEFFKILSVSKKYDLLKKDPLLEEFIPDVDIDKIKFECSNKRFFTNVEEIKENMIQREYNQMEYANMTEHVRNPEILIELAKFQPTVLSTWATYPPQQKFKNCIELYKMKIKEPEIIEALEKIEIPKSDEMNHYYDITNNIAKVLLNEKVMSKVNPKVIADFIKDVNIENLKNIIIETYGEQAKKIFEDRPKLSMEQIQNLDIFDEKVIEKFGIGAIHNMLSYQSHAPAIIGELVRNPNKMREFEIFSEITTGYFEDTPLGFENKLVNFYRVRKIFLDAKLEDFTPERKEKLLIAINDMNMTDTMYYDVNETAIISLENLEDLDRYEENRNSIYDNAIKETEKLDDVKDVLFKKFFGMQYKSSFTTYAQKRLTIKDMLQYYNVNNFISDKRTLESDMFTEKEIDQLELISIINRIESVEVLKELYEEFNNRKEEILGPIDFNSIKSKIPEQYSQELIDSLLTVEDAKRRAKEGENGISYIKTEDDYEIIKLSGADFRILIHTAGMNNSNLRIDNRESPDEIWKYFEDGCSTISGCVIEGKMLRSCAHEGTINLGFTNVPAKQIIGMSHRDAGVSHKPRSIAPEFESVKFNYPEELVRKTAAQITGQENRYSMHQYNEVTMYRGNTNLDEIEEGTLGGKLMPDYIVVYGEVKDKHKEMAKNFSTTDKPIPIMQIDIDKYPDNLEERGKRKEEKYKVERESCEIVKNVRKIADMEER